MYEAVHGTGDQLVRCFDPLIKKGVLQLASGELAEILSDFASISCESVSELRSELGGSTNDDVINEHHFERNRRVFDALKTFQMADPWHLETISQAIFFAIEESFAPLNESGSILESLRNQSTDRNDSSPTLLNAIIDCEDAIQRAVSSGNIWKESDTTRLLNVLQSQNREVLERFCRNAQMRHCPTQALVDLSRTDEPYAVEPAVERWLVGTAAGFEPGFNNEPTIGQYVQILRKTDLSTGELLAGFARLQPRLTVKSEIRSSLTLALLMRAAEAGDIVREDKITLRDLLDGISPASFKTDHIRAAKELIREHRGNQARLSPLREEIRNWLSRSAL